MTPQQPDEPVQPQEYGEDDGHRETRAAERSAQRAAAVAETEGFHPLRVRPYVAEPSRGAGREPGGELDGGEPDGTPSEPLITTQDADTDAAETADLGLLPGFLSGVLDPLEDPAGTGAPGAGLGERPPRGRRRRRSRGLVVTAAAVAASALAAGAVAVTGRLMGDDQVTDRALPEQYTAMPDVTLPPDAGTPAATHRPAPAVTGPTVATASPTPSVSARPASGAATTEPAPSGSGTAIATLPQSVPTTAPVLQSGDYGPEVVELQQRLAALGIYHGNADGEYGRKVEQAVATFQAMYKVSGDPSGVYGPHTRTALERLTS